MRLPYLEGVDSGHLGGVMYHNVKREALLWSHPSAKEVRGAPSKITCPMPSSCTQQALRVSLDATTGESILPAVGSSDQFYPVPDSF